MTARCDYGVPESDVVEVTETTLTRANPSRGRSVRSGAHEVCDPGRPEALGFRVAWAERTPTLGWSRLSVSMGTGVRRQLAAMVKGN